MGKKVILLLMFSLFTTGILVSTRFTIYAGFGEYYSSSSPLKINVMSDKEIYFTGQNVTIYGNLTFYGELLPDRLVALEIDDSSTVPFIFRTLSTGANLTDTWKIEVTRTFIGDDEGNQLYTANRGTNVWIWVCFRNNHDVALDAAIAITIYDETNAPMLANVLVQSRYLPDRSYNTSYKWKIPTDAQLGNATIYANAFTELPKNEGAAYCPEKSETFLITSATAMTTETSTDPPTSQTSTEGNYNSTFTLPSQHVRLGNYTVSVAATYKGMWEFFPATNTTQFEIRLLGDINRDAKVDIKDLVLVIKYFGSYPGHPTEPWNPNADINNDGKVDIKDLVIVIRHFGEVAFP